MTDESLDRDPVIARALGEIADDISGSTDVMALQRAITARAAPELARRRLSRRRTRLFMPASLAAGIALFALVARGPHNADLAPSNQTALAGPVSIEELLDANVSDGQFRALVSGASDANDLLSIAAGESQP
jgi:hypothetical protein